MEESTDRELEAILKLIKLTQDGTLKWQPATQYGDLVETSAVKYSSIMTCTYNDKLLRIFSEKKLKDKPSKLERLMTGSLLDEERAYPHWVSISVLEISNNKGQSLWRFAYKPAIKDLLNAAKYQASGVKDFLDSILSK